MAWLGYARVSKDDGSQSLDLQRDALLAAGVVAKDIYEDTASGAKDTRPGLAAALKAIRKDDVLVVWRLDRLGRDLQHLVTIVDALTQQGVGLKVLTGQGAQIDTTSAAGRAMFGMFAVFAEYERALLIERTRAGLAAARVRGRVGGRPRRMTAQKVRMMCSSLRSGSMTVSDVARELQIHRSTVYDYVAADGTPTALGQALLGGRAGALAEAADEPDHKG